MTHEEIFEEALHRIASWAEGKTVDSTFDCPVNARIAREALLKAGRKPYDP